VVSEYKMVDTKPDVVLLDFTPIETALYEEVLISNKSRYNKKDPVRELCCKLNYDWGKTLEEMREFMIKKKKQDVAQQEASIVKFKDNKKSYQEGLKNNNDFWYRNTAQRFIADYEKNLAVLEKTLKEHQRVLRQFEEIVRKIEIGHLIHPH
jgi:hypothetical protein